MARTAVSDSERVVRVQGRFDTHRFFRPRRRRVSRVGSARKGRGKRKGVDVVLLVVSPDVFGKVRVGEDGGQEVDFRQDGRDLQVLSLAIANIVVRDRSHVEELRARPEKKAATLLDVVVQSGSDARREGLLWMLVEHAIDESAKGLKRLAPVDELFSGDRTRPLTIERDAEVFPDGHTTHQPVTRERSEGKEWVALPEFSIRRRDASVELGLESEEFGQAGVIERARLVLVLQLFREGNRALPRFPPTEVFEDPHVECPVDSEVDRYVRRRRRNDRVAGTDVGSLFPRKLCLTGQVEVRLGLDRFREVPLVKIRMKLKRQTSFRFVPESDVVWAEGQVGRVSLGCRRNRGQVCTDT